MADSVAEAEETHDILSRLSRIAVATEHNLSIARVFMLTGEEAFAAPLEQVTLELNDNLTVLRQMLADHPDQLLRLAALEELLEQRLALSNEYLRLRRLLGLQQALEAIPAGGEQLAIDIRTQLTELEQVERTRLELRRVDAAASHVSTLRSMIVMGSVGFIALMLAVWAMRSQTALREATERALRASESRYRVIVDTAHEGIWVVNVEGRITYVNQRMADMLGYSRQEILGRRSSDFTDEEGRKIIESKLERRRKGITERYDFRYLRKDGSAAWTSLAATPMVNKKGKFSGALVMNSDITELKRAVDRLSAYLESAPDATLIVNAQGEIRAANAQVERLLGYSRAELTGRQVDLLIPEARRKAHPSLVAGYCEAPVARSMGGNLEITALRTDGRVIPVEISLGPLETDGEKLVMCSIRDLTERKKLESQLQQSQKMEVVGQLTGGIAHDFNNLLTVILGNLQLIEESSRQDKSLHASVKAALDAGFRGAELTKRLLAFSRLQVLQSKVTDINQLVTEIKSLLERSLGANVSLKFKLGEHLWVTEIDRSQMENSLVNLAINARDAMPGGGSLAIETANTVVDRAYAGSHTEIPPGEYVLVTVSDTGTGIPKSVLENVFEPFFTTKEFGKGSGLGLSMVYGFIKQSKGHISIYSEEGYGTTFKLYLPRSSAAAEPTGTPSVQRARVPSGHETILVVEDEEAVRKVAVLLLKGLGYRVLEANSGKEALAVLDEHEKIDLLFTDMVMPGGATGAELGDQARQRRPGLKVLYTSGFAESMILKISKLQPVENLLNKPYRKEDLAQAIRDVLDEVT